MHIDRRTSTSRTRTLGRVTACAMLTTLLCVAGGCSSSSNSGSRATLAAAPVHQVRTVYVTDFYLDPAQIKSEHFLPRPPGPGREILDKVRGEDPESRAKRLIRTLSETIVSSLKDAGVHAQYLPGKQTLRTQMIPADADLPKEGWIVSGWFNRVDEGNRAVDAAVGFGAGHENVGVEVAVSDLAGNVAAPFLLMGSQSEGSKMPGGIVTLNPYVIAAKFVLSHDDIEKDVKTQGKAIAAKLVAYMNTGATPADPTPGAAARPR